MAKRSPLNKRYQKDAQVGSTRKSAAAAKIKKPGSTSSAGSKKTSAWKRTASAGRASSSSYRGRPELPPELKSLQKFSFLLLGIAFVISAVYLIGEWQGVDFGKTWSSIILGFAYAIMFGALYIDFAKIRPWIRANRGGGAAKGSASAKGAPSAKQSKAEKPAKAGTPGQDAADGDERN